MKGEDMTPEWLDEIEARREATTPGPWYVRENGYVTPRKGLGRSVALALETPPIEPSANQTFIAHSWEDVKDLVAEVKFLHSLLADAEDYSAMFRHGFMEGQKAMQERLTALLTTKEPPKKIVRDGREFTVTSTSTHTDLVVKFGEVEPEPYERKEPS